MQIYTKPKETYFNNICMTLKNEGPICNKKSE